MSARNYSVIVSVGLLSAVSYAWAQAPSSVPAPSALPAVMTPPAAPATEPTVPSAPVPAETAPAIEPKPYVASYGDIPTTVLFSDDEITQMKSTLDQIEPLLASGQVPAQQVTVAPVESTEAPVTEALPSLEFPAVHVSSVVYRGPRDWMIWMNGKRVTPKRNDGVVRVVGVRPDQVQLSWKPENWMYRLQVWEDKGEMSPEMKKLQSRTGATYINTAHETVSAIMRPNQTWVTVRPMIVEGKHTDFAVIVTPQAPDKKTDAPPASPGETPPDTVPVEKAKPFSGRLAQEYIETIAKRNSADIYKNSRQYAQEQMEKPKPAPVTPAVQPVSPVAAGQGNVSNPTTQQPVMPTAGGTSGTPQSLNDVLNAISNSTSTVPATPNVSGNANTAPAMQTAPIVPVPPPVPGQR